MSILRTDTFSPAGPLSTGASSDAYFSTADVVILGWRLGLLADKLQENELAAVRALAKRYADVDRHTPFVASIAVTSIAKQ